MELQRPGIWPWKHSGQFNREDGVGVEETERGDAETRRNE